MKESELLVTRSEGSQEREERVRRMYTSRSDEILLIANDNLHLIYIFATLGFLVKSPNVVYT